MAKRVRAPASFSAALMDTTCPASTVFAAFHACGSTAKEVAVYRFNGHEGGRPDQWALHARFLAAHLPAVSASVGLTSADTGTTGCSSEEGDGGGASAT